MYSQPSGIAMMMTLSHDFVLRRNCRIAYNGKLPKSDFIKSTHGSHHTALVNSTNEIYNTILAGQQKKKRGTTLTKLPVLPKIQSGEQFGLVESEYSTTYQGLFVDGIKEEEDATPGTIDLTALDEAHAALNTEDIGKMLEELSIDPRLLSLPQIHLSADDATVPAIPDLEMITISPGPSPTPPTATGEMVNRELDSAGLSVVARGKRKACELEASGAKKARVDGVAQAKVHRLLLELYHSPLTARAAQGRCTHWFFQRQKTHYEHSRPTYCNSQSHLSAAGTCFFQHQQSEPFRTAGTSAPQGTHPIPSPL